MYTFLHVFDDEKFFDDVSRYFESLSNVRNLFFYFSADKRFKFEKIQNTEKIKVFHDWREYTACFSRDDVDVVYFHGLCDRNNYKLVDYIGEKQKVIWWSFGAELYNDDGLPPLVKLDLMKPLTLAYYKRYRILRPKQIAKRIYFKIITPRYERLRNKFLKRVDYYTPVLPIERSLLMEKHDIFRAKPFMEQCGPTSLREFSFVCHKIPKHVLVGNSLTFANNYLDIFEVIRPILLNENRKYLFPISYGFDYDGREHIKQIARMREDQALWLDTFLPREQYIALYDNITHAIFGAIRQQGIGNVAACFRTGVKVFLYKDSIIYKQYKEWGYKVFSIEEDLCLDSLSTCLSEEDAQINYQLSIKRYRHAYRENVENEIERIFDN